MWTLGRVGFVASLLVCVGCPGSDDGDGNETHDEVDSGVVDKSEAGTGGSMTRDGTLGGACYPNDTCNSGLQCNAGKCVKQASSEAGSSGSAGHSGSSGTGVGGAGGVGGSAGNPVAGSGGNAGTAGNAGGGGAAAGAGGMGAGGGSDPICHTVNVTNATAGEKTNAAFCFGLAYNDSYSCLFSASTNTTSCQGEHSAYAIVWSGNDYGDIYDVNADKLLAQVVQGATGAFEFEWIDGTTGQCVVNGDVATMCYEPS